MKTVVSLAALLLGTRVALAAEDGEFQLATTQTGRYIVKFSTAASSKMKRDGSGTLDSSSFYTTLGDAGHDAAPARSFDSDIFSGVSFDLAGATNVTIANIQALPDVEKIWPAALYTLPVSSSAVVTSVNTTSTSSSSSSSEFSTWNAHNDTNVARVQADGYLGDGVVIGFVDTGIDYNHPALGGGFGYGFKVEGGYDLVGDSYEAGGVATPDSDPMDCLGHGTHTAGIAASLDSIIPGVAPNAKLRAYKVFGCSDGTLEDNIVAAFLMAYQDGVDIISASLGSDQGFPDTAMAEVATTISNAGVFVSIAAGNSGENGPFYSSSGGNGNGQAVTVGSVQAQDWVAYTTTAHSASGESRDIVYLSSDLKQFQIDGTVGGYFPSNARNITACDWSSLTAAPSSDVYIVPRGTCLSQVQDSNLIGLATYVFYTLSSEEFEVPSRQTYSDDQPTGAAAIRAADGDWLLDQYEGGYAVNFTFAIDHAAVGVPRASFLNGRINDFSSWGPTLDGRMKPEISAPGGSIMSTWLVDSGSWAVYSGTSMATPYISGVAALFFSSRGGRASLGTDASRIARNRIIGSGAPIYHNDGTENLANVGKQGAGLVDALKVIEYDTLVQPANLNLNDTVHFVGTHDVEITNAGASSVTYQISHTPGQTSLTKGNGDAWTSLEPPYSTEEGYSATVALSADEITVGAGETAKLTLTFTEPATVDAAYMPVYGGQIQLIGSNGETVAVTYMGIKGDIYASDMWEMARGVPVYLSGTSGLITEGTNYTFEDGSDVPQVYFNLLWSSREFSFDYVSRDWTPSDWVYPPVAGENNWLGSFRLVPNPLTGTVVDFPLNNYPRFTGGGYAQPQGVLANGTKIPSGDYMILGRALRTFGDASNIEDWQYKTSAWFRITRDEVVRSSSSSIAPTSTVASTAVSASSVAATTTAFSCPTANPTSQAITLKAYVGNATTGHNFYRYSNFLGVDLADSQSSPLTSWNWVVGANTNGTFRLETSIAGNTGLPTEVFASVHTNTNSLVYMYAPSSIIGSWSYLECSIGSDNSVTCVSGEKHYFYICESGDGLVRHGTTVIDGCTPLKITAEFVADDPRCQASASASATSSAIASSTSAPPSATSSAPVCSGTADPVLATASLQGSDTEYALYQYSDFLSVDLSNSKTDLTWSYVNSSHLQTTNGAGTTVYAGVHSNNNSLIYLYTQSRLISPYSFLECVDSSSGILECTSAAKKYLYICETDSAILRSGSELLSGCTAVTIKLQRQCVPAVSPSSSLPVSSLPSSTIASASSASVSASVSTLSSQSIATSSVSSAASSASSAVSSFASSAASVSPSSSVYASISSTISSAISSAASEVASSSTLASESALPSSDLLSASSVASTASTSSAPSGVSSASSTSSAEPSSISLSSSAVESSMTSSASASASSAYSSSSESVKPTSLALISSAASSTASSAASSVASLASTSALQFSSLDLSSTPTATSSSVQITPIAPHSSVFPTNSSAPASASSVPVPATASSGSSSALEGYTTSTVYATSIATITACPTTVVNCPAESKTTHVTTVIVAISTTVCPVSVSATSSAMPSTATAISQTGPSQANTLTASLPYGTGTAFQPIDTTIKVTKASASTSIAAAAGPTTTATKKSGTVDTVTGTTKATTVTNGNDLTVTPASSAVIASAYSSSTTKGATTVPAGSSSSATTLTAIPTTTTGSAPSASATSEVVTAGGTVLVVKGYLLCFLSILFLLY